MACNFSVFVSLIFAFLVFALLSTDFATARREFRIRGGIRVTDPAEYPYVVLFFSNNFLCTGSIISPNRIVTAGHCVCSTDTFFWVKIGVTDATKTGLATIPIIETYTTLAYNRPCQRLKMGISGNAVNGNDIAIGLLGRTISFVHTQASLINLKLSRRLPPGSAVFGVGYGLDVDVDASRPGNERFGLLKMGRLVTGLCPVGNPDAICVIPDEGRNYQVTGSGDSGGPLVERATGRLVGVVSGETREFLSNGTVVNRTKIYASIYGNSVFIRHYM